MVKRHLCVFLAAAWALVLSAPAAANHGPTTGHLPASNANVDLVGKLQLTNAEDDAFTDVATYRDTAYVGRWPIPACPGGFYSIDISNPSAPRQLAFVPLSGQSAASEGVHALRLTTPTFTGDVLLISNEPCSATGEGGISLYDVTNPANPVPLSLNSGDRQGGAGRAHSAHSAFAWDAGEKAYVVTTDNVENDFDMLDITDPRNPVLLSEVKIQDLPATHDNQGLGSTISAHDVVVRRVEGQWQLLISYWDPGYIVMNVDNPANPVYLKDTDWPATDPLTGLPNPEGNAHEAEWDRCPEEGVRSRFPCGDVRYILGADEDFSPFRPVVEVVGRGVVGAGEFGFTPPLRTMFPNGVTGPTVWGGSGCVEDLNGNGVSDRAEVPAAATIPRPAGQEPIIVFTRGVCFFSDKIRSGELAGYRVVAIGQSHGGSGNGLFPESFFCGGQGSPIAGTAAAICISHQLMHQLFGDAPSYTGADVVDMPAIGTRGETMTARGGVFDGWGYLNLFNADTMAFMDAYAVPQALDERFASGFGDLSVHEVTTDPTGDVGYLAYYSAGFRVVDYSAGDLREVGHYIDTNGNDIWGVELNVRRDGRLYALASDRDYGLYIYRFGTDLRLSKSAPARTRVGNIFSYRIAVRNTGTIAETNTIVRDRLPAGVRFVSASASQGSCSYSRATRTVRCNVGRLVNDAGRAFVTIRVEALRRGLLRNTVAIQGRKTEYDIGNNTARARTRVLRAIVPAPAGGRLTGGH
jgi:uncharacterized repeat protein (TIGR01451 family)